MSSLELDPNNSESSYLFAKLSLSKLNLSSLRGVVTNNSEPKLQDLLTIMDEYYKTPNLNIDEDKKVLAFVNLYKEVFKHGLTDTCGYMLDHYMKINSSEHEQIGVIIRLLMMYNGMGSLGVNYAKIQGEYFFEIKECSNLEDLRVLNSIDVFNIRIKGCKNVGLKGLALPKVRKISIINSELDNWSLHNFHKLNFPLLKTLIFDGSNIEFLTSISFLEIESLSMRNLKVEDFRFLNYLPKLKTIYIEKVPEGFPQEHISKIKVIK